MTAVQHKPVAIIDIGSNSVRMVIYHALTRVPMPLFNEKYYCGLGAKLSETGRLCPEGKALAIQAITRFMLMIHRFDISQTFAIATAAVREAEDGEAFIATLHERFNVKVNVPSGDQEARLAALGVIASIHQPAGITADLGGGSLDISRIDDGSVTHTKSLSFGSLQLAAMPRQRQTLKHYIHSQLTAVEWLDEPLPMLYAVGGTFRAIVKLHSRIFETAMPLLHEYRLTLKQIKTLTDYLFDCDNATLVDLPGVAKKRTHALPASCLLLHELMQRTQSRIMTLSVAGIREGLMFDALPEAEQQHDPLMASAQDLGRLAGRQGRYAEELFQWMQPLCHSETPQQQRLRYALCLLSEIAWTIDPNFRAEWSYLRIMQSDMKGMNHAERCMLAMALYHRYQIKWKKDFAETAILDESQRLWARSMGLATNLAFYLSGGQAGNLYHTTLSVSEGFVSLDCDEVAKPLLTETVEKRLEGLGEAFNAFSSLRM